jgi:NADH-quinone oxidoreductase subunit G
MPIVTVDGKKIEVENGMTVIQACELAGVEIPRFCYHERLAIAGNCRMCLVELERVPKPVASCAQPVSEGMVIKTNTPMVKKAREGVMEFLLINHPLDCPICDQGGECDLQDQALFYGRGNSRYAEEKRAVKDKDLGPLIQTHMTRCIHCTRCVRFLEDVAGIPELGAVGRGEDMEITTYVKKSISSEVSGNIIDLCPVGALTSKPYEFKARNWELRKTESIDVLDAVGSNIRIDSSREEVLRILPRLNEDINEEWISDKTRFAYDGLKYQRLDEPMVRQNGILAISEWETALNLLANKIKNTAPEKIGAIAGDLVDVETMTVMKEFLNKIGSTNHDCRQDGSFLDNRERAQYIFNTTIAGVEEADQCLIFASNPRQQAPILNLRLRRNVVEKNMQVATIGHKLDLTYPSRHLGDNPWILRQLADGSHPYVKTLAQANKLLLIIGTEAFCRPDYEAVLYNAKRLAQNFNVITSDWNGYNVLNTAAARVGGFDIGFLPGSPTINAHQIASNMDILFLLGADELDLSLIPSHTLVVYIGHHGDKAVNRADIILPGAAYTEKEGTYVNLEGRPQQTRKAVSLIGQAKLDWQIINELAVACKVNMGLNDLSSIRNRMREINEVFAHVGQVRKESISMEIGKMRDFTNDFFAATNDNFYQTDPISRASRTMAECLKANK